MTEKSMLDLLNSVKDGRLSTEEALEKIRTLPFDSVDTIAELDLHRTLRQGQPEAVYGEGKSVDELIRICRRLFERESSILITRVSGDKAEKLMAEFPELEYNERAGLLKRKFGDEDKLGLVAVLAGGTSDLPVVEEACETLDMLGNNVLKHVDVGVAGLHRLLDKLDGIRKANVAIVAAGMEGALASVVGGLLAVNVIAVPTSVGYGSSFGGLAAMLSMLNSCSSNVSVVNVDNGFGAAYNASLINRRIEKAKG